MEEAAVRLAELVGYRSTGTVEYLYDASSGKWYMLKNYLNDKNTNKCVLAL